MRVIILITACFSLCNASCKAQLPQGKKPFSRQDTLRGSITPERAWWDVIKYDISLTPDLARKTIKGTNILSFKALKSGKRMQIDLQVPMKITGIVYQRQPLPFTREGNVYYVDFPQPVPQEEISSLQINYEGAPREAVNPPWDGGWIWTKDRKGNPWISSACQVLGASSWYPCKDHQSDEPDSAVVTLIVPDTLVGISNGRLRNKQKQPGGLIAYTWAVTKPINNYAIVPYIGKYAHWAEQYEGEKGKLDLDYWALEEDLDKARRQFKQVPEMLKCFEYWFGPYPFYEDGYKLVQAPYLGMEHQTAIAYGNEFKNGYRGRDLSGSGWGMKWDYIIVHESGHEWFGNNITTNDIADMWVHEGITHYGEALFTECQSGKAAGSEYSISIRKLIANDRPLIGAYGVNNRGSDDIYYKGGTIIHMIRQLISDDEKFRALLRGLNADFYHQTVDSRRIEDYISEKAGIDLSRVFDQYLRTVNIPTLEYRYNDKTLQYRWSNCVPGFNMPLKIFSGGKPLWIYPTEKWKKMEMEDDGFKADRNFYIQVKKINR
ncbi:MAG TPA: M1 family metallopeptidase [Flavitalea sp.]|nr:M1 family metallopeptidase [Flavitalea sp.]